MRKIAIFASGSGSNAENIIRYFSDKECADVVLVLSNKANSLVLNRAHKYSIPTFVFTRDDFKCDGKVNRILELSNKFLTYSNPIKFPNPHFAFSYNTGILK